MKRTIIITIIAFIGLLSFGQNQEIMIIEKTDNTTQKIYVEDIRRITFDSSTPTVTTGGATNITSNSATVSGTISGVSLPVNTIILYGTSRSLSFLSSNVASTQTNSTGSFSVNLSGLRANTTYYYQAVYRGDGQDVMGSVRSFTTSTADDGKINGYEYADLGLPSGLKWATCNIGASSPEQYGGYYAWGEMEEKKQYEPSNYQFYQNNTYVNIGMDISSTGYDIARMKWGGTWRMPTMEDFNELTENCTSEWTKLNGVNGYKFTSKRNGKSIFLPAAGRGYGSFGYVGERGYYWSSTHDTKTIGLAYCLYFKYNNVEQLATLRFYGNTVRPVAK